ncbi:hypothetical protein EJ02DRAFT_52533 [Clathrospora elynae]|uniref:Uncharacterized protein n=1 Tax=Clathrospora elynae TaxID=706981 RepID=A0A6A5T3H8_9PLEO|nr:hypothetical protein EJ02DRAFT_52533 [Clathrospora elynae]
MPSMSTSFRLPLLQTPSSTFISSRQLSLVRYIWTKTVPGLHSHLAIVAVLLTCLADPRLRSRAPCLQFQHQSAEVIYLMFALEDVASACMFRGLKGEEDLATHRRIPESCQLLVNIPRFWGINQTTFERLKPRKGGVQSKSDVERWREIYELVISDAGAEGIPSPCNS